MKFILFYDYVIKIRILEGHYTSEYYIAFFKLLLYAKIVDITKIQNCNFKKGLASFDCYKFLWRSRS